MNEMQEHKKKKKGKAKCYINVVVLVAVGFGQALLPNLNNMEFQELTFDDLFLIYSFIIPIMARSMENPNMKIISVI